MKRRNHGDLLLWVLLAAGLLVAGMVGGAWWWLGGREVAAGSGERNATSDVAVRAAESATPEVGASGATDGSRASQGEVAARVADTSALLAAPDAAEERELVRRGRVLYWGRVLDPEGQLVADADLYYGGEPAGRSDEVGRYRIATSLPRFGDGRLCNAGMLAARKAGVGSVVEFENSLKSCQQVDLQLERTHPLDIYVSERASGDPVAGIDLELRSYQGRAVDAVASAFLLTGKTGADGVARFEDIPQGSVALFAHSRDFHSGRWWPATFQNDEHPVRVNLFVDRMARVRGYFEPWPPPGPLTRLLAMPSIAVHVDGPSLAALVVAVKEDGRFEYGIPPCDWLDMVLEAGGGSPWVGHWDIDMETGDLDVGRIGIEVPARVIGHVALPPDVLALGFRWRIDTTGGVEPAVYYFPVQANGSFEATPLPPGTVKAALAVPGSGDSGTFFPRTSLASLDLTGVGSLAFLELTRGETTDVGPLAPEDPILCGRVITADGRPVVDARVALIVKDRLNGRYRDDDVRTDAAGNYLFAFRPNLSPAPGSDEELRSRVDGVELCAIGPGGISTPLHVELPPPHGAARHDLVLTEASFLRGRVVDGAGRPLSGWSIEVWPQFDAPFCEYLGQDNFDIRSRVDGSFEITGLLAGVKYSITANSPDGDFDITLDAVAADTDGILLQLQAADAEGGGAGGAADPGGEGKR